MSARSLVRRAWLWLPARLRIALLGEAFRAEREGEPAPALRRLFDLEDRLAMDVAVAAMRYGGGLHPRHRLTGDADFFASRVHPGERVVDLGCGLGSIAHAVAAAGAHVLALDEDALTLDLARSRFAHPRLEFRRADARRDPLEGPCDVVILSHVLEHLEHRRAFLHRLRAHLAPTRALIALPLFERAWTVPLRRELAVRWMSDDTHRAERTREEWLRELEDAGLQVVHHEVAWGELRCEARF